MATVTDYASLTTAVAEYLARETDAVLIPRIPTFIQLTEAKANRELYVRQMEARSTALVNMLSAEPQYISLPGDFQSMRRIRITTVTGFPPLEFVTNAGMDELRFYNANATGQPTKFTIFGNELELYPSPDTAYGLEMVYRAVIPPLTTTNTTNWLLTLAPDFYLYGALLESAPYIKEDARIQTWGAGFTAALDGLNRLGMASTFNAGPLMVRTSSQVF